MSADATLEAFAYGEHLEPGNGRSLGFRLLTPEAAQPWSSEVETLARRLQSAPFPDHWPTTDLFCSVLLADGHRLVALARYGLEDHTPGKRRGGLELMGVVIPNTLSVTATLGIYQWLRRRRATTEALGPFAGTFDLVEVLAEAPAPPPPGDPVPVLPIRMWQEGALLFAATTAADPDLRLGMLDHNNSPHWQWLPLTGADFPLSTYTQRGPIVAWTPHLTGVALKFDHPHGSTPARHSVGRSNRFLGWCLVVLLVGLLGANGWYVWRLEQRLQASHAAAVPGRSAAEQERSEPKPPSPSETKGDHEAWARALYQYLRVRGCIPESRKDQLIRAYERLAAGDESLQVGSTEGKLAIGAISSLTRRKTAGQVQAMILDAGEKKGIDEKVLELIAERVSQRMVESE